MGFVHLLFGPQPIVDDAAVKRVGEWVRGENLKATAIRLYRTPDGRACAHVQTDSRLSAIDMLTLHVELTPAFDVDLAKTKPARAQVDDKLVLLRKLWPGCYRETLGQVWADTDAHDPWIGLRDEYDAVEALTEDRLGDMRYDDVGMSGAYECGF